MQIFSFGKARLKIWISAALTCLVILFGSLSGGLSWWSALQSWPMFPLLPIILIVFLYGVRYIDLALIRYQVEQDACEEVNVAISGSGTPEEIRIKLNEIQIKLIKRPKGEAVIGRRIGFALATPDLDTALASLPLSQRMDVEEDKTFGKLQFLRNALVLLGLLSTVIFFARALATRSITDIPDLVSLISDLQRALTMTMAGVATSVVLGWQSTGLFHVQQDLKAHIDELTARMLPRLLPHYERGTTVEPSPALVLEKLQDFFREVETWKFGIGAEVDRLSEVLIHHRDVLQNLPAVSLPKGFTQLTAALTKMETTLGETRNVIDQALQILSQERNIDLNKVINLLSEIHVDSEQIKEGQAVILKEIIPKQTQLAEKTTQHLTTVEGRLGEAVQQLGAFSEKVQNLADAVAGNTESQRNIVLVFNEVIPKQTRLAEETTQHLNSIEGRLSEVAQQLANPSETVQNLSDVATRIGDEVHSGNYAAQQSLNEVAAQLVALQRAIRNGLDQVISTIREQGFTPVTVASPTEGRAPIDVNPLTREIRQLNQIIQTLQTELMRMRPSNDGQIVAGVQELVTVVRELQIEARTTNQHLRTVGSTPGSLYNSQTETQTDNRRTEIRPRGWRRFFSP